MKERKISKELSTYRKLLPVARKLIVRLGNLRCEGHGEAFYMQGRVLDAIIEPWGYVVVEKSALDELLRLQEEKQAGQQKGELTAV